MPGTRHLKGWELLARRYIVVRRVHGVEDYPNRGTRLASRGGATQPARNPFDPAGPTGASIPKETIRFCWSWIPGGCGLYGPRQLGDGLSRRIPLQLRTAVRGNGLEPDGDAVAIAVCEARRSHGSRLGAGVP